MQQDLKRQDIQNRMVKIIVALGVMHGSGLAHAAGHDKTLKSISNDLVGEGFAQLSNFQDSFSDAWDDGIGAFTKWLDDVPPDWNDHGCSNWANGDASC